MEILFKSISLLTFLFLLTAFKNEDELFLLTVEVKNLRNSQGVVKFALYNTEGSIPDENYEKCFKVLKAEIVNSSALTTFKNLPKGKYAVSILHDENCNDKIDKGFILPKEGIGFSNYQSINLTNRPNFTKASFLLDENKTVRIVTIYM